MLLWTPFEAIRRAFRSRMTRSTWVAESRPLRAFSFL